MGFNSAFKGLIRVFVMLLAANKRRARLAKYRQ